MYVQRACEQAVLLSCKCLSYVWCFVILHGWQFDLEASIYLHFIFAHTWNSLFGRWWCRHDKFFLFRGLSTTSTKTHGKNRSGEGKKKQRNEMNFFAEHIEMNNFKSQPFVNCRRCILNMCDEFYTFARMTNSNGYIFSFVCILQIHWCLFSDFFVSSCTEPFETR